MLITNKYNLPQAWVDAVKITKPQEGIYSATTLINGTKEIILYRRYFDRIVVDVTDMAWALFGTAIHSILESKESNDDELVEMRMYKHYGKNTLSGQPDLYDKKNRILYDFKSTSVWKVIHKNYDDWQKQLNLYALLIRHNFKTDPLKGIISALMKDYNDNDRMNNPDYPKQPIIDIPFNINITDIDNFVKCKLAEIDEFNKHPDHSIAPCEPEERWAKPTKYAVMKEGKKRATRVLDSQDDAMQYINDKISPKDLIKVSIETRPGEDMKCQKYCLVNHFCSYYQEVYA